MKAAACVGALALSLSGCALAKAKPVTDRPLPSEREYYDNTEVMYNKKGFIITVHLDPQRGITSSITYSAPHRLCLHSIRGRAIMDVNCDANIDSLNTHKGEQSSFSELEMTDYKKALNKLYNDAHFSRAHKNWNLRWNPQYLKFD